MEDEIDEEKEGSSLGTFQALDDDGKVEEVVVG